MLQLRLWGMTLRFIGVVAELHLKLLLVVLFFSCWYGGQRCCWWEWGCRDVSGGGRDASPFIVFPSTALCTQLLSAASLLIAAGGFEKRQSFLSRCPKTIQILQHHFILLYVMCNYMCSDAGTLRFNIHCSDRICFGMIALVFRWKHTLVFIFSYNCTKPRPILTPLWAERWREICLTHHHKSKSNQDPSLW